MTQPAPARLHWRYRADLWLGALFFALTTFGLGMPPGESAQTQAQAQEDVRFFRIAAGPIGGGVFALAGVLAGGFSSPPGGLPCNKGGSCGIPGMIAVVQGVDGSLSALEALQNGQADTAIAALDVVLAKGASEVTPLRQFRTLATLFTCDLHILVRDESDYRTPQDLRSKRILLAGDTRRLAPLSRAAIGATVRSAEAEPSDALAKLAEGEAEAVLMLAPAGSALLVETAKTLPLRLLPVDAALLPAALANFYHPTSLAGGLYAGIASTATVGLPVQLLTDDTMPVALAQRLTGVLWHNATAKSLTDGPPEGRAMRLDQALMGVSVPLHPGAAAYYREIGKLANTAPTE